MSNSKILNILDNATSYITMYFFNVWIYGYFRSHQSLKKLQIVFFTFNKVKKGP